MKNKRRYEFVMDTDTAQNIGGTIEAMSAKQAERKLRNMIINIVKLQIQKYKELDYHGC